MLVRAGRHAQAEQYLEKAAVVYSLIYGEYDERTHEVHAALGRVQVENKSYKEAIKNISYLLIQHEFKYGKNTPHLVILEDHNLLGQGHFALGEESAAIKHFTKALEIADKIFIGVHPEARKGDFTDADSIIGDLNEERKQYALIYYKLGQVYEGMKSGTSIEKFYECLKHAFQAISLIQSPLFHATTPLTA